MQDEQCLGEFPRCWVALLCREVDHSSQTDRGHEQECEPCTAADETGDLRKEKPGCSRDYEHKDGCNSPAPISSAGTPGTSQDRERRDHRNKEKNMV